MRFRSSGHTLLSFGQNTYAGEVREWTAESGGTNKARSAFRGGIVQQVCFVGIASGFNVLIDLRVEGDYSDVVTIAAGGVAKWIQDSLGCGRIDKLKAS